MRSEKVLLQPSNEVGEGSALQTPAMRSEKVLLSRL